ncbi:MAG TPA: hypothetical protein VGT61_08775 [Thermomicrobiales bacterium]|jgi:hypothetical protein|nr:hypothetical protein [Thermomicrobiales bacterium]
MTAMTAMMTGWAADQDGLGCGGHGAISAGTFTPAPVRAADLRTTGTSEGARANALPVAFGTEVDGRQATGEAGRSATSRHDDRSRAKALAGGGRGITTGEAMRNNRPEISVAGANPPGTDHRTAQAPKTIEGRRANADLDTCLAKRDDWIVTGRFPVHMG